MSFSEGRAPGQRCVLVRQVLSDECDDDRLPGTRWLFTGCPLVVCAGSGDYCCLGLDRSEHDGAELVALHAIHGSDE